ncbi:competence protein, partial [Haloferax sp. Atlit-6N]
GDWRDDGDDVIAYLEAQGVTRIDHLVTSHPDADHIGGHAAVIEHFETNADGVGAVYDPGIASSSATYDAYLDAVETHDVTLYRTQAGDSIQMSGVEVRVLAPPEGYLANKDSNENSIVLYLQFGASSFLLPGDGEATSEEYLI